MVLYTLWFPGQFRNVLSAGEHFGVDMDFAQSSSDKVRILTSEVEDEDRVKEMCDRHRDASGGCFVRGAHCKESLQCEQAEVGTDLWNRSLPGLYFSLVGLVKYMDYFSSRQTCLPNGAPQPRIICDAVMKTRPLYL